MSAAEEYDGDDNGEVEQAESTAEFKPVVELPTDVQVTTGEEDDEVLFKERCKLHRFAADSKEWKERGTGDVRLLKNKSTGMVRVVMRQEKTNKLVLNHFVHPSVELKTNPGSDTTWVWSADDFSEGSAKKETFAMRFKTVEIANSYKSAHTDARKQNEKPQVQEKEEKKEEEAAAAQPAVAAAAPKADA